MPGDAFIINADAFFLLLCRSIYSYKAGADPSSGGLAYFNLFGKFDPTASPMQLIPLISFLSPWQHASAIVFSLLFCLSTSLVTAQQILPCATTCTSKALAAAGCINLCVPSFFGTATLNDEVLP